MIKDILLPEKIRGHYLFAKRVAGFALTKTYVYVTVAYLRGDHITIEQCLEIPIEADNGKDSSGRTADAIKKALATIGKPVEIHTAVSSEHTIFKTMKLPFNDTQKIKKVIDFEAEPLLPFSISDAVIDFIVTRRLPEEKSAEIMIAAVQKTYITHLLELFSLASVQPDIISVDLFDLYGFYRQIPQYEKLPGAVTLIDMSSSISKLVYIVDGQLRFVRNLHMGTAHIVKELASQLNIPIREALEDLMRFGFEKIDSPDYTAGLNKACAAFATQMRFSLQSFTTQSTQDQADSHIFLLGSGANIKGLSEWLGQELGIKTNLFNPTGIVEQEQISLRKIVAIPVENSISTSLAIPCDTTQNFNLRQKEFSPSNEPLLLKQLVVAAGLVLLLLSSIFVHSYLQVRKLRNEMHASKQETIELLYEWFPNLEDSGEDIQSMIEDAQEVITQDEKLWFSFSPSVRNSFLAYLLELTNLDRDGLGLVVEKLSIDQERGMMILKARVKDEDALKKLENELRQSNMFMVQPQEDPDFTMELRFKGTPKGGL